jgi:hypothetical protein
MDEHPTREEDEREALDDLDLEPEEAADVVGGQATAEKDDLDAAVGSIRKEQ